MLLDQIQKFRIFVGKILFVVSFANVKRLWYFLNDREKK